MLDNKDPIIRHKFQTYDVVKFWKSLVFIRHKRKYRSVKKLSTFNWPPLDCPPWMFILECTFRKLLLVNLYSAYQQWILEWLSWLALVADVFFCVSVKVPVLICPKFLAICNLFSENFRLIHGYHECIVLAPSVEFCNDCYRAVLLRVEIAWKNLLILSLRHRTKRFGFRFLEKNKPEDGLKLKSMYSKWAHGKSIFFSLSRKIKRNSSL